MALKYFPELKFNLMPDEQNQSEPISPTALKKLEVPTKNKRENWTNFAALGSDPINDYQLIGMKFRRRQIYMPAE